MVTVLTEGCWRRLSQIGIGALMLFALAGCGGAYTKAPSGSGPRGYVVGKPYQIKGQWYFPAEDYAYDQVGLASWYGSAFHGNSTANGETFDRHRITAAHATLPMPVWVRVTNLDNGQSLVVRINDRGPFVAGRIIDLSEAAARELGFRGQGIARVRVQYVGRADQMTLAAAQAAPSPPAAPRPVILANPPGPTMPLPPRPEATDLAQDDLQRAIQALPSGPSEPLTQ